MLFDKHNTRELARSLGIAVAKGRLPRPDDTADAVFAELGRPVVVKPRKSYSVEELQSRGKVRIVDGAAELQLLLPTLDPGSFLYEAFFPGRGAGVSVLAHRGKVLQAFEHHRVRETGAGSYYRISAGLTPELERSCADIVAALSYTGVAMFEFRLGDGGGWILLEVNARPWGSMPLPVGLGIDFPYRWFKLLVDDVETPSAAYRVGIYGRNLIPDLWSTLSEGKHLRATYRGLLGFASNRFFELGRMFTGREIHDVLVGDDLKPGLLELRNAVGDLAGRVARRIPGATLMLQMRARAGLARALGRAAGGEVRLLIVCQGNICRSPFAEALLRARLLPQARSVALASFGMLPRPGRPSPDFAIAAAAARGVDLRSHRSAHLSRAEAEAATAIFVFDDINRAAILERYPDLSAPVLRLGDFAPDHVGNIDDPIDGNRARHDETYDAIAESIAGVARLIDDGLSRGASVAKGTRQNG